MHAENTTGTDTLTWTLCSEKTYAISAWRYVSQLGEGTVAHLGSFQWFVDWNVTVVSATLMAGSSIALSVTRSAIRLTVIVFIEQTELNTNVAYVTCVVYRLRERFYSHSFSFLCRIFMLIPVPEIHHVHSYSHGIPWDVGIPNTYHLLPVGVGTYRLRVTVKEHYMQHWRENKFRPPTFTNWYC